MTLLPYRKSSLLAAVLLASGVLSGLAIAPAHAQLVGQSVTGNLRFGTNPNNYFDPAEGYVPAGYLNQSGTTVTISGTQTEFGFDQRRANLDTADFTDSQLTITDVAEGSGTATPFSMMFTSSAFTGLTLTKVSDNFYGGGLTAALVGNTLTVNSAGGSTTIGATYQGVFNFTPTVSAVPEPSEYAVGGVFGATLLVVMVKARRKKATASA